MGDREAVLHVRGPGASPGGDQDCPRAGGPGTGWGRTGKAGRVTPGRGVRGRCADVAEAGPVLRALTCARALCACSPACARGLCVCARAPRARRGAGRAGQPSPGGGRRRGRPFKPRGRRLQPAESVTKAAVRPPARPPARPSVRRPSPRPEAAPRSPGPRRLPAVTAAWVRLPGAGDEGRMSVSGLKAELKFLASIFDTNHERFRIVSWKLDELHCQFLVRPPGGPASPPPPLTLHCNITVRRAGPGRAGGGGDKAAGPAGSGGPGRRPLSAPPPLLSGRPRPGGV